MLRIVRRDHNPVKDRLGQLRLVQSTIVAQPWRRFADESSSLRVQPKNDTLCLENATTFPKNIIIVSLIFEVCIAVIKSLRW
jgi:hypothetical protein